LSVPDEGYYVPDEGYYVPDEDYYVPDEGYYVPDEGYYVLDEGYYVPDEGYYVPDEGYYVPDEGYYVPDEGYYVPDEGYYVHDEGYSRNALCALNLISTFLLYINFGSVYIVLFQIASRVVLIVAGIMASILAIFGKFGAFMTSVPDPVLGGISLAIIGVLCSLGISAFQNIQLRSSRNISIIGISIYLAVVVSEWQRQYPDSLTTGTIVL
jgi:hypothetical protein